MLYILGWHKFYYKLLNLVLTLLVKSKVIPNDPIVEFGIDISRPIMYILPYKSKTDLLLLRTQCHLNSLPDPLEPIEINGTLLPRCVFIHDGSHIFPYFSSDQKSVKLFYDYLDFHRNNSDLEIQMIPVSVMFGRAPGRDIPGEQSPCLQKTNKIQRFFSIFWLGRDSFIHFSPTVSFREIVNENGTNQIIEQKLVHIAYIHFSRQRLSAIGPSLPMRQDLFNKLLKLQTISKAIEDEARKKKISLEKAKQNAIKLMEEIAANFSYEMIRLTDRIIGWIWNKIYQGINVSGSEHIRKLALDGHSLVYIPCHRSHMDYLLLSYVLYHQGLAPPHIAAGINLNFWPTGPIFRRLGAFFIRRTFKSNKLYSTVFREYLSELFYRGYSIEYFIEGGRSRTGRLLDPKTGTLSMTIQAILRGSNRPITIIPVYIGYEHVMEVSTYAKELRGAKKEKESFIQMLRGLKKIRNLGYGYVNFGEPLSLINYLNLHVPEWRNSIDPITIRRPQWLASIANDIAQQIMVRINNAAAANAVNLCVTALLASVQKSLTRKQLLEQLECYLMLLRNFPYSKNATIPDMTPEALLEHAIRMNKLEVEKNEIGDTIVLPQNQAELMTYYRNNIHHALAMPSLIASVIRQNKFTTLQELLHQVTVIYPLIKGELFLRWNKGDLPHLLLQIVTELAHQKLILVRDNIISLNTSRLHTLQILANGIREMLQRYSIAFSILIKNPTISRSSLEKESCILAENFSILHGINAPEFFDKAVFSSITLTIRDEGYISHTSLNRIKDTFQLILKLITKDSH